MTLKEDALYITKHAINAVLPDSAVINKLNELKSSGLLYQKDICLVAIGKAAYQMSKAASDTLSNQITKGIVITKYGHLGDPLPNIACYEAGHPVPDHNSITATNAVIDMINNLSNDTVILFLISGGGSALFESPLVSEDTLSDISKQLLFCGADITEINTIRKRLSAVKGGKFAKLCEPHHIYSIILSDIIGDPLDMIASGPAYPDSSTCSDALSIIKKYNLTIPSEVINLMSIETPKSLSNVTTYITGSVRLLCEAAKASCEKLGYNATIITDSLSCEAKEAGKTLAKLAIDNTNSSNIKKPLAFIAGGETVVHVTGSGLGGRNQELVLSAAKYIDKLSNVAIFSIGSDGTDGPTDAAGGFVDGNTNSMIKSYSRDIDEFLANNDAYHALELSDGLIKTGPTGTNVNDVAVVLIK